MPRSSDRPQQLHDGLPPRPHSRPVRNTGLPTRVSLHGSKDTGPQPSGRGKARAARKESVNALLKSTEEKKFFLAHIRKRVDFFQTTLPPQDYITALQLARDAERHSFVTLTSKQTLYASLIHSDPPKMLAFTEQIVLA